MTHPARAIVGSGRSKLEALGWEIGRPGTRHRPYRIRRRRLRGLALEPGPLPGTFVISLDRIRSFAGFSYLAHGWHPYRAAIRQIQDAPETPYLDSELHRFYSSFQPRTVAEVIRGPGASSPELLARLPAWLIPQIWTLSPRQIHRFAHLPPITIASPRQNSEHVGPIKRAYGEAKLRKLTEVLHSMSTSGYRPLDFAGGIIEGILVFRERDYSFVPTEGQHRLAALDLLGYRRVLVRLRTGGPTIDDRSLRLWTDRAGGVFAPIVAEEIHSFYLRSTGTEQAQRWNLAPPRH